jgi:photosystem II stability/assembly factor-like uncharacterized protein
MQEGCWTALGPHGEWVTELASTELELFAGTHDNGVFRLEKDGARWEGLGLDHAIISSILVVPGPIRRLLVGVIPYSDEQTSAAVFSSEDQGRTWTGWDGGMAARNGDRGWAYALAFDPGEPERLYMSYFESIARSHDGGRSWEFVFGTERDRGGGHYDSIIISPERDGTVWAAGETSIFTSQLLRSRDWGNTWEVIWVNPRYDEPGVYEDNGILSLAIDPGSPNRLFAGLKLGYVLRSDDGGTTWTHSLRAAHRDAFVYGLQFVGSTLYAATTENFQAQPEDQSQPITELGLYRSHDGGESWDTLAVPSIVRGGAHSLAADSEGRLLIGTRESGVWRFEP